MVLGFSLFWGSCFLGDILLRDLLKQFLYSLSEQKFYFYCASSDSVSIMQLGSFSASLEEEIIQETLWQFLKLGALSLLFLVGYKFWEIKQKNTFAYRDLNLQT